jgi:AcrR family transcriptional regulator
LTREQIVRAAIELLDAEGIDGLSMRQLGLRLGSAATAVYWHIQSKENLVALAGDAVWSEIELPDLAAVDWRGAATTMAKDLYAMIIRHPWLLPAMSTHLMYGPGKARHDDHLLAVYEMAGLPQAQAQQAAMVVVTFVLGMALGAASEAEWRARMRRTSGGEQRIEDKLSEARQIAMGYPRLSAVGTPGDPVPPGEELDFGLRAILGGLPGVG